MNYRIVFISIIMVVVSLTLHGGTPAKVKSVNSKELTIDKGTQQGVAIGKKGKVCHVIQDPATDKDITLTLGKFIVKEVNENTALLILIELEPDADPGTISCVEFDETLIPPKDIILNYIKNKEYGRAGELLQQTENFKITDDDFELLKTGYLLLIADQISVKDYIGYKSKKNHDIILKQLADKLYKNWNDRNIPPEKYLDENIPINKNEKGYYEITFKDKNDRVMIYIPDKKLFVDKYEVSCARAKQAQIEVNPIAFSAPELTDYPNNCPDYPAIVEYNEAEKYCKNEKLRLLTEEEWEYIAGRSKKFDYCWGNKEVDEDGLNRANFESMNDGYIELAPVVSFEPYPSPYGVINMAGNVAEWVKGKNIKGGDFMSEKKDLKITSKAMDPSTMYVGFRCVMEAGK
ncbi:MAG: formylglycine-generating enzyme family protein [Candidatus Omnitrophota bacterium]